MLAVSGAVILTVYGGAMPHLPALSFMVLLVPMGYFRNRRAVDTMS